MRGVEAGVLVRDHSAPPREGLRLPERLARFGARIRVRSRARIGARMRVGVRVRVSLRVGGSGSGEGLG